MNKLLASIFGILLVAGLAIAEPPDGKGKDKGQTPGPVQVLANGESVGTFLQSSGGGGSLAFEALSSTGYHFFVVANAHPFAISQPGDLADWPAAIRVYYESPDCTSPAYVRVTSGGADAHFSAAQGFVFPVANANPHVYFYVPAGSVPEVRQFQAEGLDCSPYYLANSESVEAFPNDPAITGVSNTSFTPPITLGH
jgi:hypothetical protein